MAERELEQILDREYRRFTRGAGSSKSRGLLDFANLSATAPARGTSIRPPSGTNKPTLAAASAPSDGPINKGYSLPAPASLPSTPTDCWFQ